MNIFKTFEAMQNRQGNNYFKLTMIRDSGLPGVDCMP